MRNERLALVDRDFRVVIQRLKHAVMDNIEFAISRNAYERFEDRYEVGPRRYDLDDAVDFDLDLGRMLSRLDVEAFARRISVSAPLNSVSAFSSLPSAARSSCSAAFNALASGGHSPPPRPSSFELLIATSELASPKTTIDSHLHRVALFCKYGTHYKCVCKTHCALD